MNRRRLDTVLRIRSLQERLARAEIAHERAALTARERAEADVRERLAGHERPLAVAAPAFRSHRRLLAGGVVELERARRDVSGAHDRVAVAVAGWSEAARRREGIERLHDRLVAEERVERDQRDAAEVDDLVVGRWGQGRES